MAMKFSALQSQITTLLEQSTTSFLQKIEHICALLQENVAYYDWVGFYFKNGDKDELKLKAYAGEPTAHDIIPFGKGICGQVAISNQNFVVPDVKAQDNYIACSRTVKAELVIPLFKNGNNIGQIDIDSNTPDPFTEADERFLEWVNVQVSQVMRDA